MSNPYVGANITGCNSPTVGNDRSTYTGIIDTTMAAIDNHDHTTGKGKQVPAGGIVDAAISAAKLATDAVTTAKILDGNVTLAKLASSVLAYIFPSGVEVSWPGAAAVPTGFLLCNGDSLLRASYPALFLAIGTAHGAADSDHFNLPDRRGMFLRGTDSGAGTDPNAGTRTAAKTGGATGDNVGSVQADATAVNGLTDSGHTHGSDLVRYVGSGSSWQVSNGSDVNIHSSTASGTANLTGDSETRPVNGSTNWIIKT